MATLGARLRSFHWDDLRLVLVLTRREIRDALRDWRIVIPILLLTLFFPGLMTFTADQALAFVERWGATIVAERLVPFLLMVVGFFPMSFSLVIALETFVGEKERKSLEPLLATPLSDAQLYLGKMLAATVPPLLASYLGIIVYLVGLYFSEGWKPPPLLLVQVVVLTTMEGVVMVSGAVVVSSQTTSVRAANLLASFIVIPVALLIQVETGVMFWARYDVLWWIVLLLVVVDLILVRMGLRIFNREELLGREIDQINLSYLWRTFRRHLRGAGGLRGLYLKDVPAILRRSKLALGVVLVGLALGVVIGWVFAVRYPLPPDALALGELSAETFTKLPAVDWLPAFTPWGVLVNNVRALALAALLAVFSFGTMAVTLLMAPLTIVSFFVTEAAMAGYNPLLFFAVFIMPHGVLELPAAIVATALAVRLGASFVSPPAGLTVGEAWLQALADFVKVFFTVVVPLLAAAAWLEVYVTPQVVLWAYGG